MKRFISVVLALVICLLLCGCDFLTFTIDGLLASPIIADEQTAIHEALIKGTGKDIFLEYPHSGDNRSAFVLANIDKEADDEALAFYSLSSDTDEDVRLAVLDRDEKGDWVSVFEIQGAGNTVDKVIVNRVGSNTDIIVGYGTRGYEESQVIIYRYYMGALAVIYESSYSVLELYDLDGCGEEEIIVIGKTGVKSTATVIKSADGISYITHEAELSTNVLSIEGYVMGKLDGERSILYIDILDDTGYLTTELLYLTEEGLICPSSSVAGLSEYAKRPSGYLSVDYDGDGVVEVPITKPFTGYMGTGRSELMTEWYSYSVSDLCYVKKSNAYYSSSDGYVFTIPNRWLNVVTVTRNDDGALTFVKYDGMAGSLEEMKPIMTFASLGIYEDATELEDNGFTELCVTDFNRYFVKILADESEPLVLTNDEIKDNFYGLD